MTSRQLTRSVPRAGSGTTLSGAGLIRFLNLERDYMNAADKIAICARCKEARMSSGLTELEMAEMLEPSVTDRTIRNYESDRPPFRYLRQWADITGTEYLWLLRGDEGVASAVAHSDPDIRNHLAELAATVAEIARGQEALLGHFAISVPDRELTATTDGPAQAPPKRRKA